MFPLRDSHSSERFPFVTSLIIAVNILVFFHELTVPNLDQFIAKWGLIPVFVDFNDSRTLLPFITSQFIHAGWIHIIANMWFLWVFGNNVEASFGKFFYPVMYLLSGVVGGLAQYFIDPNSNLPMIGASGAIAGVLGSYIVLFPRNTINSVLFVFALPTIVEIPAGVMLVYWFFTQLLSGFGALAIGVLGGVAWFAHVGGFLTGWLFANTERSRYIHSV